MLGCGCKYKGNGGNSGLGDLSPITTILLLVGAAFVGYIYITDDSYKRRPSRGSY